MVGAPGKDKTVGDARTGHIFARYFDSSDDLVLTELSSCPSRVKTPCGIIDEAVITPAFQEVSEYGLR